jgi:hypothetical protein
MESHSGRAVVLQNNDEPHVQQKPYATVGSGEYHRKVPESAMDTDETGAPVAAM